MSERGPGCHLCEHSQRNTRAETLSSCNQSPSGLLRNCISCFEHWESVIFLFKTGVGDIDRDIVQPEVRCEESPGIPKRQAGISQVFLPWRSGSSLLCNLHGHSLGSQRVLGHMIP